MKFSAILLALALGVSALPLAAQDQHPRQGGPDREARSAEAKAKLDEEAAAYYADADSALYGVRYIMTYLFNKEKNLTFKEDRVVLISPRVSMERSYEGIGETRWRNAHPGQNGGGALTLAYRLTPDYYFYYPDSARQVNTYRILSEEFLVSDSPLALPWQLTDETKKIGEYTARKATLDRDGRQWTAWFTTDLPCQGAPRDFNGLPGVVLELADSTGEVAWTFHSIVESLPDDQLFIQFPEHLRTVAPARRARL
ncbi:MAG: GLPGLI family protein, partial [Duncaniella sp.]|nr:GLPGLI family protein [Duncaniella sp.]